MDRIRKLSTLKRRTISKFFEESEKSSNDFLQELEKLTAGRKLPAFIKIINRTNKEIEIYEIKENK